MSSQTCVCVLGGRRVGGDVGINGSREWRIITATCVLVRMA